LWHGRAVTGVPVAALRGLLPRPRADGDRRQGLSLR